MDRRALVSIFATAKERWALAFTLASYVRPHAHLNSAIPAIHRISHRRAASRSVGVGNQLT